MDMFNIFSSFIHTSLQIGKKFKGATIPQCVLEITKVPQNFIMPCSISGNPWGDFASNSRMFKEAEGQGGMVRKACIHSNKVACTEKLCTHGGGKRRPGGIDLRESTRISASKFLLIDLDKLSKVHVPIICTFVFMVTSWFSLSALCLIRSCLCMTKLKSPHMTLWACLRMRFDNNLRDLILAWKLLLASR